MENRELGWGGMKSGGDKLIPTVLHSVVISVMTSGSCVRNDCRVDSHF